MTGSTFPLAVRPLQWALPDLGEAQPLDGTDLACLDALRDVLTRHGKLDRFAIHLAHQHFSLQEGEVLIERPDAENRTQHVTVGRLADFPAALPTTWLFDCGHPAADADTLRLAEAVYCVCLPASPLAGNACSGHARSSTPSRIKSESDALAERNYQKEKARLERGWPVAGHEKRKKQER